ncbi:hypothetical protein Mal4_37030 [Maioricimonas rarisocia]|uniref:Uncharacterized protein n=1 Tax=Maioricimonas rarisocia TaxID=2528026 RepID=A0A517ZA85_9PLAN|nr:hypothetical protein Mal4_37030 [Maioricimonas rarisocia]
MRNSRNRTGLHAFRLRATFSRDGKNARIRSATVDDIAVRPGNSVCHSYSSSYQLLSLVGPTTTPGVVRSKQRGDLVSLPESCRRHVSPPVMVVSIGSSVRLRAACGYDRPSKQRPSRSHSRTSAGTSSVRHRSGLFWTGRPLPLRPTHVDSALSADRPAPPPSDSRESRRFAHGSGRTVRVLQLSSARRITSTRTRLRRCRSLTTAYNRLPPFRCGNKEHAPYVSL